MLYPMRMAPCYKEYLWGGKRLKEQFGKLDAPTVTAESWELAFHASGASVVAEGEWAGKTLGELAEVDKAAFWGNRCERKDFPILVKLIDAKRDLSIQVHPSDTTALTERGERGKAEMWYVVECEPQSFLYFGLSQKMTLEQFLTCGKDGTICQYLNRVPVKRGDVFYILPGTIHAIGAGMVVAEIQQNSDTTFRIYDYGRKDAKGNPRELHLERASHVVNLEPIIPEECKANNTVNFPEFTMTEMFSCNYFKAFRLDLRGHTTLFCDGTSFHHLLCTDGEGTIRHGGREYSLQRGDSYFMPAALGSYELQGACRVLLSRI